MILNLHNRHGHRGAAAVELAIILPVIIIILFGLIELGYFFTARFIVINVAREGANLASREIQSASDIIGLMQTAAEPLDIETLGHIYISKINAGQSPGSPNPARDFSSSADDGDLEVASSVAGSNFGLSGAVYNRLVFNSTNMTSDISGVTIVEVFYLHTPIMPWSDFIPGLMTRDDGGIILQSRAVF